jgi:hypothetical protein
VRLAQTLLHRKLGVCGTGRANRGIPYHQEGEGKHLKEDSVPGEWCKFGRTRLVRMISMIYGATTVSKGRKDRKTNMEIKNTYAVVQYNKFIKDVDRADQYFIH